MKSYWPLIFIQLLLVFGCKKERDKGTDTRGSQSTPNITVKETPSRWNMNRFPLKLHISNDFHSDEAQVLRDMAIAWTEGLVEKTELVDPSYSIGEKNLNDLAFYDDDVIGVYKLTSWPEELSPSSLGVTQVFGFRRNYGSPDEFIEIVHGDIFLNYENFGFKLDDSWGYSLQSLALHELGHLLGLSHDHSSGHETVMYPYLRRDIKHHAPTSKDLARLKSNYAYEISSDEDYVAAKRVLIRIELLSSGEEIYTQFKLD